MAKALAQVFSNGVYKARVLERFKQKHQSRHTVRPMHEHFAHQQFSERFGRNTELS